jgi:hypothetical protein
LCPAALGHNKHLVALKTLLNITRIARVQPVKDLLCFKLLVIALAGGLN